jgi:hypothetical protein
LLPPPEEDDELLEDSFDDDDDVEEDVLEDVESEDAAVLFAVSLAEELERLSVR